MLVKSKIIVPKDPDFDPFTSEFDVELEKILVQKGSGKWTESPTVINLEKILAVTPHPINADWTYVYLEGGLDIIIGENVADFVDLWQKTQSLQAFKPLYQKRSEN